MKKYLIFDLDGTLIQSNNQINTTIYNYLKNNINEQAYHDAKYYIEYKQGMSLQEAMEYIITDKNEATYHTKKIYSQINKTEGEIDFFDGSINIIKKLSKDYTLFLSTGNSDEFANDMLKKGDIYTNFSKILGSSIIQKSSSHIDEFIHYTGDTDFYKHAIYIGDGQRDREIAKEMKIDFIHIGNDGIDEYEIESVKDIYNIIDVIQGKQ